MASGFTTKSRKIASGIIATALLLACLVFIWFGRGPSTHTTHDRIGPHENDEQTAPSSERQWNRNAAPDLAKQPLAEWLETACPTLTRDEEDAWLIAEGRSVTALLAVALSSVNGRRNELLFEVLQKDPSHLTALLYGSFDESFPISSKELIATANSAHPTNAYVNLIGIKEAIKTGDFQTAMDSAVKAQALSGWDSGYGELKGKIRDMYVDTGRTEGAAEIRNFLEIDDQILIRSVINASTLANMPEFASATTRDKATMLGLFQKLGDNSKESVSSYLFTLAAQKSIIESGATGGDTFENYLDRPSIEFSQNIQSEIDSAGQLMFLTADPTAVITGMSVNDRLEFARKMRNLGALEAAMSLNRK